MRKNFVFIEIFLWVFFKLLDRKMIKKYKTSVTVKPLYFGLSKFWYFSIILKKIWIFFNFQTFFKKKKISSKLKLKICINFF